MWAPIKVLLLCHQRLSCVRSRTINFHPTRAPATPSNGLTGLYSNTKLYHTGLEATKAIELHKWYTWSGPPNIRRKQINQHFDLGHISRILDKIIFHGLLGNYVVLRWVEAPTKDLDWLCRTTLISDHKRGPCDFIEVMKPVTNGPWTLVIIQECLEAMLLEMTRVFFEMYIRDCVSFQGSNNPVVCGRKSRNGSLFRKLVRGVEQEANRTLKGLSRPWHLRRPYR